MTSPRLKWGGASVVLATVVAAIIAAGGPGGSGGTTANLWVDTNGGTCTRQATAGEYSDAAACGTFDAAYDAASCGDTVLIKGGSYGAQTITGSRTCSGWSVDLTPDASGAACTGCVFFDEPDGEVVIVAGTLALNGDYIRMRGVTNTAGGWRVVAGGTDHVLMEDATVTGATSRPVFGFQATAVQHIAWVGGELTGTQTQGGQPIDTDNVNNLLFDGIHFHGNVRNPAPDHMEVIRIDSGVHTVTIRNSTFEDNEDNTSAIFWTNDGALADPHTITIENNFIDSGNLAFKNHSSAIEVCENITVRYNTIRRGWLFENCTPSNVTVTGNLGVKTQSACAGTYSKNVWQHSSSVSCGTDTTVIGTANSVSALGLDVDGWHLANGSVAEGAGAAGDCPALDIDGEARPQPVATTCDAGADERD